MADQVGASKPRRVPWCLRVLRALASLARPQPTGIRACFASDPTIACRAGLPATESGWAQVRRSLRELEAEGRILRSRPQARRGRGFRGGRVRVVVLLEKGRQGALAGSAALADPETLIGVFNWRRRVAELRFSQPLDAGPKPHRVFARSPESVRSVDSPPLTEIPEDPSWRDVAARRRESQLRVSEPSPNGSRLGLFEEIAGFKIPAASRPIAARRLAELDDRAFRRLAAAYRRLGRERWVQDPGRLAAYQLGNSARWEEIRRDPVSLFRAPRAPDCTAPKLDTSRMPDFLRRRREEEQGAEERLAIAREALFLARRLTLAGGVA